MDEYFTIKNLAEGGQGIATLASRTDGETVVIKSVVCETLKAANFALSEVLKIAYIFRSFKHKCFRPRIVSNTGKGSSGIIACQRCSIHRRLRPSDPF